MLTPTSEESDRVRNWAAQRFVRAHRDRRRGGPATYTPDPLLSAWCAWEEVQRRLALSIADDVARGGTPWDEEVATYRLATERLAAARLRYSERWKAAQAARSGDTSG